MADKRLQMPTETAQVIIKYLLDGQPCENVFYVVHQHRDGEVAPYNDATFNSGNADFVANQVKGWLTGSWKPFAHTLASATEIDVIWNTGIGTGPLHGAVYVDSDFPIVGTNAGGPLPNNATIAVEWKTAVLGRSYHGRTYAVGLGQGQVDPGSPNVIKASAISDTIDAFDTLRDTLATCQFKTLDVCDSINDKFPMVVMSFVSAGVARSPAIRTLVTQAALSDANIDSMRRRLPGHNRHR